jgi:sugar O-acyltransferase (sialic acid O-acetyltransferase NeuD family)
VKKLALYGAGAFGREVLPMAQKQIALARQKTLKEKDVVFVSDIADTIGTEIKGTPVISYADLCRMGADDYEIVIALADTKIRRESVQKCEADGFSFGSIFSDCRRFHDDVLMGKGSIACDYTVITDNVRIGAHFQCNVSAYVAHDCQIGDFVTISPHVFCGGHVIIEDGAFIGAGACIKSGTADKQLRIGQGAIVGMGAVVTKNVPPFTTVVGNPAKPHEKVKLRNRS